jgi:hypothetical protein
MRRPIMVALVYAGCMIAIGHGVRPSWAETASSTENGRAGPACTGLLGGQSLAYRNPRWGFGMTYPSTFALDPESVTENGDSARFWTADRRATAVVTGLRNNMGQTLAELLGEAKQDILVASRGTITYERARENWFVLSGFMAGRIFYRRTFLSQAGRVIATLWIEFPRDMRPCFDDAVTTMSLSFREIR